MISAHDYVYEVRTVKSVDQIDLTSNAAACAEELATFVSDSTEDMKKRTVNSCYTIWLIVQNGDATSPMRFMLKYELKGAADKEIELPPAPQKKELKPIEEQPDFTNCPAACETEFEHTYRCLSKGGNRPSAIFGPLVEEDGMLAVFSKSDTLLISPDPKKIADHFEYTNLFALSKDKIQKIALPIIRVIHYLNLQKVPLEEYSIKWNAGRPANAVYTFHTRFEKLPKTLVQ